MHINIVEIALTVVKRLGNVRNLEKLQMSTRKTTKVHVCTISC